MLTRSHGHGSDWTRPWRPCARDAEWLVSQGFLSPSTVQTTGLEQLGSGQADVPRTVALDLRRRLGCALEPLGSLAALCGRPGLHVVVTGDVEAGASLLLESGVGVAVVGADSPPGRRRFTAAHELGHYVLQDEYATDIAVAAGRDERNCGSMRSPGISCFPRWAGRSLGTALPTTASEQARARRW